MVVVGGGRSALQDLHRDGGLARSGAAQARAAFDDPGAGRYAGHRNPARDGGLWPRRRAARAHAYPLQRRAGSGRQPVARRGRGFEISQGRLGPGRIHHCMRAIGQAELALEQLCRRAVRREAFGKKLAELGANFDIIANARMEIEMARLLCLKAAWMMDQGDARAAAPWISQIKVVAPADGAEGHRRGGADARGRRHQPGSFAGRAPGSMCARCGSPTVRMPCTAGRSRGGNSSATRRKRCEMKAIVCREYGPIDTLDYADVESPAAGAEGGRHPGRGDRRQLSGRLARAGPLPGKTARRRSSRAWKWSAR